MKDRKFHTDKELKDNYPKPGVPADKAWAEMNRMLDKGLQDPPGPGSRPAITGGGKVFWLYTAAIAVVIITPWAWYRNHKSEISSVTAIPATKNENKQAQPIQYDTIKGLNNNVEKPAEKDVAISNPVSKINLPAVPESQHVYKPAGKDTATLVPHEGAATFTPKNKMNSTTIAHINSVAGTYRNNKTKNNTIHNENKKSYKQADKNLEGGSLVHPGAAGVNYNAGGGKKMMHSKNNKPSGRPGSPLNVSNRSRPAPVNKYQAGAITIAMSSLPGAITSLIKEPISTDILNNLRVDSSYLQKMNAGNNAASKKHNLRSGNTIKSANKRRAMGFEYGLQWNAPIPVQGTIHYFNGANGNSQPYNMIIPQLWLSKGINNRGSVLVEINVNHQYFIGNKEVSSDTGTSIRDSTFHKTFLSKTGGFGATLEYTYRIYKNWGAAIGINYSVNRNALLYKQTINLYSGSMVSDSLYGIKRSSTDWQYINKSQVSGKFELYYTFKKFNLGSAIYLPLGNIPVYGNRNIHPVNAQLFLRWNIKRN